MRPFRQRPVRQNPIREQTGKDFFRLHDKHPVLFCQIRQQGGQLQEFLQQFLYHQDFIGTAVGEKAFLPLFYIRIFGRYGRPGKITAVFSFKDITGEKFYGLPDNRIGMFPRKGLIPGIAVIFHIIGRLPDPSRRAGGNGA